MSIQPDAERLETKSHPFNWHQTLAEKREKQLLCTGKEWTESEGGQGWSAAQGLRMRRPQVAGTAGARPWEPPA